MCRDVFSCIGLSCVALCCAVVCYVGMCCVVLYCNGLRCVVLCCVVVYRVVVCYVVLCCAVLVCVVVCCVVWCCVVLYCVLLWPLGPLSPFGIFCVLSRFRSLLARVFRSLVALRASAARGLLWYCVRGLSHLSHHSQRWVPVLLSPIPSLFL